MVRVTIEIRTGDDRKVAHAFDTFPPKSRLRSDVAFHAPKGLRPASVLFKGGCSHHEPAPTWAGT